MTIKPGTRVENQEPPHPLTGIVAETPVGQSEPDGWIWVRWSNGLECAEYAGDVTVLP